MGAYTYCRTCDTAMSPPTLKQVLTNNWACPKCGGAHHIGDFEKESAAEKLVERLEAVEELVAKLKESLPTCNSSRCQYAIDRGVEGLGRCPSGECVHTLPQCQCFTEQQREYCTLQRKCAGIATAQNHERPK